MKTHTNLSDMAILGWNSKYNEIVKEFGYSKKKDFESAKILNSVLTESNTEKKISNLIRGKTIFVIGSGPSLSTSISKLKFFKNSIKIAADSSVKYLTENGIIPNIIVTDLDGDLDVLTKLAKTKSIFVVHAHGDNMKQVAISKNFTNCIGTTQGKEFKKIKNYGGFTDGDRAIFLASYFEARKIILFGMDFGEKIGRFSNTKITEREVKKKKLKKAESLLEWLSTTTKTELITTSRAIPGFKKITYKELEHIGI